MLHRNSTGASVAVTAILFAATLTNNALAGTFADGDFITYNQAAWGDIPAPGNAAQLLVDNFPAVYPLQPLQVGGGFTMIFTSASAILSYLPTAGTPGPLNTNLLNPLTSSSGLFGGEVVALQLNVDFSDAGLLVGSLGIPFGDLALTNFDTLPGLDGMSVRDFLSTANIALGGGATGYSFADLTSITGELNLAFLGVPTPFAQEHLTIVPAPGAALALLGMLGLAGRGRRRSRA